MFLAVYIKALEIDDIIVLDNLSKGIPEKVLCTSGPRTKSFQRFWLFNKQLILSSRNSYNKNKNNNL